MVVPMPADPPELAVWLERDEKEVARLKDQLVKLERRNFELVATVVRLTEYGRNGSSQLMSSGTKSHGVAIRLGLGARIVAEPTRRSAGCHAKDTMRTLTRSTARSATPTAGCVTRTARCASLPPPQCCDVAAVH